MTSSTDCMALALPTCTERFAFMLLSVLVTDIAKPEMTVCGVGVAEVVLEYA